MKKRISLILATLVVALVVTIGLMSKNNSVKASSNDELTKYKITIPISPAMNTKVSEIIVHYGVNGWKDIKDTTMYLSKGPMTHGFPTSLAYNGIVEVHKGDMLDYCLKVVLKNGEVRWQNYEGDGYHTVIKESNVKKIRYEVNWLAQKSGLNVNGDVVLHYGVNEWNDIKDVKMEVKSDYSYDGKKQTWYRAIVTVEEGSTIDYCIKANTTSGVKWDNNNGKNYSEIANQDCIAYNY